MGITTWTLSYGAFRAGESEGIRDFPGRLSVATIERFPVLFLQRTERRIPRRNGELKVIAGRL